MKIVALETHIVAVPPPHIGGMYWLFVKLKTDCGIEGVGEIYAATFGPKAMLPIIEDVFERYLLNHDPHHIERFFRQAYSSGFTQRPDLTMMGVVSGLEMACWDIIGKAANKPVYELLGGKVNERLRSYTYLYPVNSQGEYDYDDPDLAAECAIENMNKGFTAVKFDPAGRTPRTPGTRFRWKCWSAAKPSAARSAKRWATSATCCSAPTGKWSRPRRFAWPSVWRSTTRCGLKSQFHRGRRRRWRKSRPRPLFRLLRASG